MQFFKVHFLMFLCAAIVSGSFPVMAAITHDLDPGVLTLIRFALATLFFVPIVWLRYTFVVSFGALVRYSLISATLVFFFWCMFLSLRYTTALNSGAIYTIVPGLSGIYAMVLNRERLGRVRLVALALGVVGALWVVFNGDLALLVEFSWNRGDLIFLGGCLVLGLYGPLISLFHRGEPMLQMSFWVMFTGTFWLLLLAGPQLLEVSWPDISYKVWGGIAYLAIFSTGVTFFLTQYSILFLGPTRVIAYSYLNPGLVLVLDFLFGGILPGTQVVPGVLIVLVAMIVVQRGDSFKK